MSLPRRRAALLFLAALLLALAVGITARLLPGAGRGAQLGLEAAETTLLAVAAAVLCARSGLPLFGRARLSPYLGLCVALGFLVAVNNLPWLALASGRAWVSAGGGESALFALLCLATAAFEELLFRGFLFPLCLRRLRGSARGRIGAILLSSGVFALAHLLNLIGGAGVGATLLQVGYSFLVGCAAAVLLLITRNLAVPMLFHAVYNFGGLLVPRLGQGVLFDGITVAVTALLGAATAICLFFAARGEVASTTAALFCPENEGKSERI